MDSHAQLPSSSPRSEDHATSDHTSSPNAASDDQGASQDSYILDGEALSQDANADRHPKGKRKRTADVAPRVEPPGLHEPSAAQLALHADFYSAEPRTKPSSRQHTMPIPSPTRRRV